MTRIDDLSDSTPTLTFEAFWEWMSSHPNCILRAGTRDAVVFDDDDFHWHFAQDGQANLLVQVLRGKRLVGEILLPTQEIAFVQGVVGEHEGEFVFELISGDEASPEARFFFVLSHGFEPREDLEHGRVH